MARASERTDPTRTLTIRNSFVRAMNKQYRDLIAVIRKAIITQDAFGLTLVVQQLDVPAYRQFSFVRNDKKIEAFMQWLRLQEDRGLLRTTQLGRIGAAAQ